MPGPEQGSSPPSTFAPSRRGVLAAGGLGLAAAALSACAGPLKSGLTGSPPNPGGITYWNLFSGGDGVNMVKMEDAYRQAQPNVNLEATTLAWGNPYYTKLSLATAGNQAPDVAITHLTRMPLLAQAGILTDLSTVNIAGAGITADKFTPAAWKKAQANGVQYAVPLDTHPFVLYYNTDLAKKAGLLGRDGKLVQLKGTDDFTRALTEMKKVTGAYGGVVNINADPATNWRWFETLYGQLNGKVVTDQGRQVIFEPDKAMTALEYMSTLTTKLKLMPASIEGQGVTSLFSSGKAGFLLDGEWQIPTYRAAGVKFDVVPVPLIVGNTQVAYSDSHALVIPTDPARPQQRTQEAVAFIKSLLDNSLIWAAGGHIPAWLPVQKSEAFQKLSPQSNYVEAAYHALYDPEGWYTGSGSDFQILMGSAVATVQSGGDPKSAVSQMSSGLARFASTRPPVK